MQCHNCNSVDIKIHAKDRLKCCGCGATFVKWKGELGYRRRFPVPLMKCAILFHLFVPSRVVQLFIFLLFFRSVSRNTICEWSRKFRDKLPVVYPLVFQTQEKGLTLFADEKFITINGKRAYWWTVRDQLGNFITCLISHSRDLPSAKELFRRARFVADEYGKTVMEVVTDYLQAYCKAKNILGNNCGHIQTGIQGRLIQRGKEICLVTNNMAESGNAEIEKYLAKYNYQFPNLAAAERAAKGFMLAKYLLYEFEAWRSQGENPLAECRFLELGEGLVPTTMGTP